MFRFRMTYIRMHWIILCSSRRSLPRHVNSLALSSFPQASSIFNHRYKSLSSAIVPNIVLFDTPSGFLALQIPLFRDGPTDILMIYPMRPACRESKDRIRYSSHVITWWKNGSFVSDNERTKALTFCISCCSKTLCDSVSSAWAPRIVTCKAVAAPQVLQTKRNRTTFNSKTHGPHHAHDCRFVQDVSVVWIQQNFFGQTTAFTHWRWKILYSCSSLIVEGVKGFRCCSLLFFSPWSNRWLLGVMTLCNDTKNETMAR
jgi:hypothetical protein